MLHPNLTILIKIQDCGLLYLRNLWIIHNQTLIYLTLYDKKAIALLPGMLREICNIAGVNCKNERIVNYFLQKNTAQKLNYEGMDSQAIINITLYWYLVGLNV